MLAEEISLKLKNNFNDGLFQASMDHCPSEQLTTASQWHTTAILLSPGSEHIDFGKNIASKLRPKNSNLMAWKNATRHYKSNFKDRFFMSLKDCPVYVFINSSKSEQIRSLTQNVLNELKLSDKYRVKKGKKNCIVDFGPLLKKDGSQITISLSENRAIMCIHIAHFVLRMHSIMVEVTNHNQYKDLHWSFFADKFPGPHNDDMELLFCYLMGLSRGAGSIYWGYYKNKCDSDFLADNLAGYFNYRASTSSKVEISDYNSKKSKGLFHWEIMQ